MSNKHLKGMIVDALMYQSMSRPELLRKLWTHYSAPKELDEIMAKFLEAGMIEIVITKDGVKYRIPSEQVAEYQRLLREKRH